MPTTAFGLTETYWAQDADGVCAEYECSIEHGDAYFKDTNGKIYCQSCGKCIRFRRKRDALRKHGQED